MRTDTPRPIRLKDYEPPAWLIDKVDLKVDLHPTRTRVDAKLRLTPNKHVASPGGLLRLDGQTLELARVAVDRSELDAAAYEVSDSELTIFSPPQKAFTLSLTTYINPETNTALQGLYRSRGVYTTQCEAQGFRRICYFLDRPDVLAKYTVRIEADREQAPVLLANGNLLERGTLANGKRHYAVWQDPHPKPCYLFALVGGDLSSIASTFRTMSGRQVDLGIYVEHGKEKRAAWAMDALKRAMAWDEKRFGREYDLDVFNIVAVSDFNMGAMENKGLNVFNDRLILASPDTATDANFEAIESVVAHEYFHNWTGNRITCRDWFQLCLKEGLTVFRDQEFSADERDPTVQRITDVRVLRAHQFPEDAGPLAHPVRPQSYIEINNFYTATVYEKGAEVIRMLETVIGAEAFRAGMDLYFTRCDGTAATVEDFVACFEEVTGRDLTQFRLWYAQAGTPGLVCNFSYDKANRSAELSIEQALAATPGQPKKKPMHIPVRLGLVAADGRDMPLVTAKGHYIEGGVIHVTKRAETFRFEDLPERPVPSLLRGFSAPVNLVVEHSDAELEFLMGHDSDLFNRWQAANTFATRTIVQTVEALKAGKRKGPGAAYARALQKTLVDETLKHAYRAELLRLPSQADIAREIAEDVDPGLIHKAHRQLTRLIGQMLGETLEELHERLAPKGAFSPDAASAGKRALRNTALALLVARGLPADHARLSRHFFNATNMTDEGAGLILMAQEQTADRIKALDHFFDRWKSDHLVIDSWFAAQAQSPHDATLDAVVRLLGHPLFSLTAPNKVRALIGNFALANPVQFNRPDGRGYEFLADQVLALNATNPQIAARMLSAFRSWRALEPGRRKLARKALARVARAKQLSRDVYEIVSRMLEG